MTWTKLSDDFGDLCARIRLSDRAFRTHVEGLVWCMRRENGGRFPALELSRFGEARSLRLAVKELIEHGFWREDGEDYIVVMGMEHQPDPEVLGARRDNEAERQRRSRRKRAGLDEGAPSRRDTTRDNTRDQLRDNTPYPGRGGAGLGGAGSFTTELRLEEGTSELREVEAVEPDMTEAERWQIVARGYDR